MTALRFTWLPDLRVGGAPAVLLAALCALAVGAAVGFGLGPYVVAALVCVAAAVLGVRNWRWSLYGLLLYLPVSGVAYVVLYPHTGPAALVKDVLFVLPAYCGFGVEFLSRRRRISFTGAPVLLFGGLVVVATAEALNPSLPNRLVGLIGLKLWLLYLPLYFLGYHMLRTRRELGRVLAIMSLSALVPVVVGLVEAGLIYSGHVTVVNSLYGSAASSVTQDFGQLNITTSSYLRRVPSTFSSVTQYYTFLSSMVVVVYAWWRGFLAGTRYARAGLVLWCTVIVATFLSGARGAFALIPVLVLLIIAFDWGGVKRLVGVSAAGSAGLLVALTVLGTSAAVLTNYITQVGIGEFNDLFVHGIPNALHATKIGLGAGIDSTASRYAYSQPALFQAVNGTWYESWWAKCILELGIVGLIIVVGLLTAILRRGYRVHRRLIDPRDRAISGAIVAFLVWNFINNVKGQYMDLDPVNAYFWLFAGILMGMGRIKGEDVGAAVHRSATHIPNAPLPDSAPRTVDRRRQPLLHTVRRRSKSRARS